MYYTQTFLLSLPLSKPTLVANTATVLLFLEFNIFYFVSATLSLSEKTNCKLSKSYNRERLIPSSSHISKVFRQQ